LLAGLLYLSKTQVLNDIPPIIIVDIDEHSLKKQGRWPWSRKTLSKLVTNISQNSPAVVVLDIVLSENEKNPISILEKELTSIDKILPYWIKDLKNELDADAIFSRTIKDKEVVLGYPFHKKLITHSGKLPSTTVIPDTKNIDSLTAITMRGYTANLLEFSNNVAGSGFFSISPDRDGNIRRAPIVAIYNDQVYPSLALEAARIYMFEEEIKLHSETIGNVKTVTHVSLGKNKIPTDAQGQILVPFLGKQGHFDYISAHALLESNKPYPELENAIVLIGTSAQGLSDLRPTPLQASFPGVEIQANILHGILHPEKIAYTPDWTEGALLLWLVILSLLMILLYPLLKPFALVLSGIFLFLFSFGLNYWFWYSQQINLPIILPLLLIMAISSLFVIHDLFIESKGRQYVWPIRA